MQELNDTFANRVYCTLLVDTTECFVPSVQGVYNCKKNNCCCMLCDYRVGQKVSMIIVAITLSTANQLT